MDTCPDTRVHNHLLIEQVVSLYSLHAPHVKDRLVIACHFENLCLQSISEGSFVNFTLAADIPMSSMLKVVYKLFKSFTLPFDDRRVIFFIMGNETEDWLDDFENRLDDTEDQFNDTEDKSDDLVDFYLDAGLEVIPLIPGLKKPIHEGYLVKSPKEQWINIKGQYNIGLRLGKVIDIENDDAEYGEYIDKTLLDIGMVNFPKYKSGRGIHRLFILDNKPVNLKTMNLVYPKSCDQEKHYGEFRAHGISVMPYSIFKGFQYEWLEDSEKYLNNIPHIKWSKIKHLTLYDKKKKTGIVYKPMTFVKPTIPQELWIEERMQILATAQKGLPVVFPNKTYPTRSEAEAAVVSYMISQGWTFQDVLERFEKDKPGHFVLKRDKRKDYLTKLYDRIYHCEFRKSILKEMTNLETSRQRDRVYHILLSIAFQYNGNRVSRSYEQLAKDLSISNRNSKNGPRKACLKLEQEGKITIIPGKRYHEKTSRRATEFVLNELCNKR